MSRRVDQQSADGVRMASMPYGKTFVTGTTTPTNGQAGFAKGCIYQNVAGSVGSLIYVNTGTTSSTTWTNIV